MYNIQNTVQQGQTPGTLGSQGLYIQPQVPRNSQARGISGTDGRGYTRTVGPDELVENRLNGLTSDPNNRYLSQARGEAQRQASSRGLGNSSISAGAGVRAAIQSALPIASQDANTFSAAAGQNLDAMNANLMQERDVSNRMLEAEKNRMSSSELAAAARGDQAAERDLRLRLQRENLAYSGEQAGLNREHDIGRMGAEFGYRDQYANNELGRSIASMGANANFQDWLSNNSFERGMYANIVEAQLGASLNSTQSLFDMVNAYALDNPGVFNAEDYQNFSNMANNAMQGSIAQIFANLFGPRGG